MFGFSIGNFSFNLSLNINYDFDGGENLNFFNVLEYVFPVSVCNFANLSFETEVPDENLNENVSCGDFDFKRKNY